MFQLFFLVAVALACIGSAAAQFGLGYNNLYNPYGYNYPVSYGYRFGGLPVIYR